MGNANVSLQVIPRATGDRSDLYGIVDEAIKVIQQSGVKYEVGPMETTLEGDYDELMEIVKKAQEAVVAAGSQRVMTVVKIDYCPDGVTMEEKVGKYRA
ncbi:MAG TPA: MTH1187 family thiamine-binding protein [Bacillales bacterium]